jgi:Protein of unknown function (DUF3800)
VSRAFRFAQLKCITTGCSGKVGFLLSVNSDAKDFFRTLSRTLFSVWQKDRYIVTVGTSYQAYFDEAGTHNDDFMVVAGFIGKAEEWETFNDRWLKLMGSEEAARSFKADSCNDPLLMRKSADLAIEHTVAGFAISICPGEYKSVTSDRFRSQHGSAYTLCLKDATSQVGKWADYGQIASPFAYFFDAGHPNRQQADQYFARVRNQMPDERRKIRLGSWTFGDDELIWPLKAADLLAWTVYQSEYFQVADSPPDRSPVLL